MYDYPQQPDGMQPRTAGILLALLAFFGIGFFILSAILGRTDDPMYDRSTPEQRNSAQLQMTPDLWKRKQPIELPSPTPQPPQPVTSTEPPTPQPRQPAAPPTTKPQ